MAETAVLVAVPCDCGAVLGHYVTVENQVWIEMGGAALKSAHGHCSVCKRPFHYNASDKMLEALLERRSRLNRLLET